jgi:diguanylate cyclase (GGDEF)-like protein
MDAVAAARNWWAAWRQRLAMLAAPLPANAAGAIRKWWATWQQRSAVPTAPLPANAAVARGMTFALLALAAATIACAVIGYAVTERNDSRLMSERYAALQVALDEFHAVFGEPDRFDSGQIRLLARRSGLKDLRFEPEPVTQAGREMQSLHDRDGRITGWLSWRPDRTLIRTMLGLWGGAGAIAVALGLVAALLARRAIGLTRALARSEETVRRLTSEDELTGLPNQRVMLERLDQALASRGAQHVALAIVDLDGFREVNETLGRAGGDGMVVEIAKRLIAALPPRAQCGRYEDDEFAIILAGDDAGTASRLAGAVHSALSRPIFMNQMWQIAASIGLAQAPDDGGTREELTRRAELALHAARHKGRGLTMRFEPQIETAHEERRFITRELKKAVAAQALDVHYQPVVAADGSGTVGVEALLRWNHPQRGTIAPAAFIPVAEQDGLMPQIGEFVLRRAVADAARWPNVFIAVNLSPVQIRDRSLVPLVAAVMAEHAIEPSRVVLEVTEGVLIDDPEEAKLRLEDLRALGVHIALDDFGSGYSSLSYLQQFPFDRLKIDRAFVASLGSTGNVGAIIQSIVTLGHALGMIVLAEGIETDEQRVLLRLSGCDEMQGYLFAKPVSAEAIDALLQPPARPAVAVGR